MTVRRGNEAWSGLPILWNCSQLALNILKILKDAIASSLGLCGPLWKPGTSPVPRIRPEQCGL